MTPSIILHIRQRVNALHDPVDRLAQQVGELEAELTKALAELSEATGKGYKPAPGFNIITLYAGDAELLLEYEYKCGEDANYDVESRTPGPGSDPSAVITSVLVQGWCEPTDILSDDLIERLTDKIITSELESASDDMDYARSEHYDNLRDLP